MENEFKPKVLIWILLLSHLIPYIIWCFVKLTITEPFIYVFGDSSGRGVYVFFLVCVIFMALPFTYPFVEPKEKPNQ
jgi:hypothetical protein